MADAARADFNRSKIENLVAGQDRFVGYCGRAFAQLQSSSRADGQEIGGLVFTCRRMALRLPDNYSKSGKAEGE